MNDVRPERAWFEKADQGLEMARQASGDKNPENPKILKIQIQTNAAICYQYERSKEERFFNN